MSETLLTWNIVLTKEVAEYEGHRFEIEWREQNSRYVLQWLQPDSETYLRSFEFITDAKAWCEDRIRFALDEEAERHIEATAGLTTPKFPLNWETDGIATALTYGSDRYVIWPSKKYGKDVLKVEVNHDGKNAKFFETIGNAKDWIEHLIIQKELQELIATDVSNESLAPALSETYSGNTLFGSY